MSGTARGLAAHPWRATGFVAATATCFALGSTLVRFAYDAGAGTLSVVTVRTSTAALGLGLLLLWRGISFRLTARERWAAPFIGVLVAGYSCATYESLEYMPVALTVLTFYTYPLFTGLFVWLTRQERFGPTGFVALPLAFLGLLLALDVSGKDFSFIGARWALLGAVGFTAVLVLSARLLPPTTDTRPRTFVMLLTAAATCLLTSLATRAVWLPVTVGGWSGLMASSLFYILGMTAIMFATSVLGAGRVALVMNVEPVASLILTFLILGEHLRPFQLVGAACVILAIFLFRPRPRPGTAAVAGAAEPHYSEATGGVSRR